jgi:hypothetical protein
MNDVEPEQLLEGIEIAVAMKQRMTLPYAERRDQAIDCLSNGSALRSEGTVVLRCRTGELRASSLEDVQLQELNRPQEPAAGGP